MPVIGRRQRKRFLGLHCQKSIPVSKRSLCNVGIYKALRLQILLDYMFDKNNLTSHYNFPLISPLVHVYN